jgi:hypothetical protein
VIAGGSTCFAGFEARLEAELREYVAANVSSQAARQCHVVWKRNRKYSAWQGASLMQSMAGFWENEDVVSSILENDELDDGEEGSDSDESESSRASMDDHSSDGEGAV